VKSTSFTAQIADGSLIVVVHELTHYLLSMNLSCHSNCSYFLYCNAKSGLSDSSIACSPESK